MRFLLLTNQHIHSWIPGLEMIINLRSTSGQSMRMIFLAVIRLQLMMRWP